MQAGIKLGEVTAPDGVFLPRGRAAQDGEMRALNRHIRAQPWRSRRSDST
jgi:hypothetical protein